MDEISKAIQALIEFEKHFRANKRIQSSIFYRNRIRDIIDLLQGINNNDRHVD